ncbi:MAG: DUF4340 domain-containing protein [Planctomycetota bacterium]
MTFELFDHRHLDYHREQKQWWKKTPQSGKLELPRELIQPVLDTLHILEMVDLIVWEPKSLTEYGLDSPLQQWKISQAGESYELKIGKPANADTLYAMRQDLSLVFTLNKDIVASLSLHLGESELYFQNEQLQKELKEQFSTPEKK